MVCELVWGVLYEFTVNDVSIVTYIDIIKYIYRAHFRRMAQMR